jgi:hypothetical protein
VTHAVTDGIVVDGSFAGFFCATTGDIDSGGRMQSHPNEVNFLTLQGDLNE